MTMPELPEHDAAYLRIAEYLEGECSSAEAMQIESELAIDHRMQFAAQLLRIAIAIPDQQEELDIDASFADLSRQIDAPDRPRRRFRRGLRRIEILVGAAILLVFGWVTYESLAPVLAGHFNERYAAPMESRRVIRLPDGSRATLEAGARLTYRASYFPRPRTLTLEGEARFQVRPDAERPFDVHANGVLVRAVGTVFTVRADPWEPAIHVAVEEGAVRVGSEASAYSQVVAAGHSVDVQP